MLDLESYYADYSRLIKPPGLIDELANYIRLFCNLLRIMESSSSLATVQAHLLRLTRHWILQNRQN